MKRILCDRKIVSVEEYDDTEPEETGTTFAENALIKARAAYAVSHLPSFGDDSGICVDALGGAPGVYSARYAPTVKERNVKLLKALEGLPEEKRTAHFACCVAYCDGDREFVVEGRCDGMILTEEEGDGGFGYDPVFFSFDLGKSFGTASAEEKNAISHRGRALAAFAAKLADLNK